MNRTAQKRIREAGDGLEKPELRRIRRGRQHSRQEGQGHGQRTIIGVHQTNLRPTWAQRHLSFAEIFKPPISVIERVFGPKSGS